ncbi:MAG: lysophospholipid acyltransferase family protein [Eubacteriales bacterium]|nr:lysophospholipid acyltransferase family protein [Eubacteriales bacterium]
MADSGLKTAPWKQDLSHLPWRSRWAFHLLKTLSRLLYRPRYYGLENLPAQGPYIILANHQSFFDVMLINPLLPVNPLWLAKQELFQQPLIAPVIKGFGAIPINREDSNFTAVKQVLSALKEGQVIGVFPEATRLKAGQQATKLPKVGLVRLLARADVPLIPLALEYPQRIGHQHRLVIGPAFRLNQFGRGQEEAAGRFIMEQIYQLLGPLPSALRVECHREGEKSQHE